MREDWVMGPPRREVSGAVDADAATDETVERAISLYCILWVVLFNGMVGVGFVMGSLFWNGVFFYRLSDGAPTVHILM
jgi:predicted membrane protein